MSLSRWLIPALVVCLSPGALQAMNKQRPTEKRQDRGGHFQKRQTQQNDLRVDSIRVTRHKAAMGTSIWRAEICGGGRCYVKNIAREQSVVVQLPQKNLPIGHGIGNIAQWGGGAREFGWLRGSKPGDTVGIYGFHHDGKRNVVNTKPIKTFTLPAFYTD